MSKDPGRSRSRPRPLLVALLGWLVALALVTGLGALVAVGANGPADPRLAAEGSERDPLVAAEFGEIGFRVGPEAVPGLATPDRCALLADTEADRQKGLMGRSDLGGYDAMIFGFDADTTATFFMRNVPVPLSIAWFDASGRFVSSADMEPCPNQDGCPQYSAVGPYRFALEVQKGGLGRLGAGPGSMLSILGACRAPAA